MGVCPVLNQAVDSTTISASEYNSNMNNLRSSVNAIVADQITDLTITAAEIANATITAAKMATNVLASDLVTTAGDLLYGTAADTLTRLGIGAANTKLFTNADATAPEWANGYKLLNITRDVRGTAGDVAYTGVGFKASAVIFFAVEIANNAQSWGYSTGSTHSCVVVYNTTTKTWYDDRCIVILNSAGSAYQRAIVKSFDADGFTLTWTYAATPAAGTIYIFCLLLR